jgi:tetratricopeptide (TPR) repeat protein
LLAATPEVLQPDGVALQAMCDSPEPLLAGGAAAIATYLWEYQAEPGRALTAAERMLDAFADQPAPWPRLLAHARVADLLLQAGRGEEALPHLRAALRVLEELGVRSETLGVRFGIVVAHLQLGELDEAERLLALVEPEQPDHAVDARTFGLTVRAEILLARGQVDAGLRQWRRATDLLRATVDQGELPGYEAWSLEVQAATIVAHVRHGRPDLVAGLIAALPDRLAEVLATLAGRARTYLMNFPVGGALLAALAAVDLQRGATASGVRLTVLAERFHFLRQYLPSMSGPCARQDAEQADKAAYANAVSEYAALSRDELPAAALDVLHHRDQA